MYYEERVIDGKLMYRTHPRGDWSEVSYEDLLTKYNQGKEQLSLQKFKINELKQNLQEIQQRVDDCINDKIFQ